MKPHGLSDQHHFSLGGTTLVPDLSGALYAPEYETLIVADLHLEQGASLARRGIHAPPYDSRQSLAQLRIVLDAIKPARLVLLGDSFHDPVASQLIDPKDCEALQQITEKFQTTWVAGNHDPSGPEKLGGVSVTSLHLGSITLRHEPSASLREPCEIAGHLHPGATVSHRGRNMRAKCFIADDRRIILPAFGSYTGAFSVSDPAFNGLFDIPKTQVYMLGKTALRRFARTNVR